MDAARVVLPADDEHAVGGTKRGGELSEGLARDAVGAPMVMEVALIEPSLFFAKQPGSADRFVAAVQRIGKGLLGGGMKGSTAIDLLRRNASMPFAAFCLLPGGDGETLCARSTQLLETMDPEEFQASCLCVARFADEYEATLGKDEF